MPASGHVQRFVTPLRIVRAGFTCITWIVTTNAPTQIDSMVQFTEFITFSLPGRVGLSRGYFARQKVIFIVAHAIVSKLSRVGTGHRAMFHCGSLFAVDY